MTKRLVEIDDTVLDAAREALSAATIKDTVARALQDAVAHTARRREVERLTEGSLAALAGKDQRRQLWR